MKVLNQMRRVVFALCCFIFSFSAEAVEENFPSWNVDDCRDNKAIQKIYDDIELYHISSKSVGFPTGHPNAPWEDYQIYEMRKQHFGGMVNIIHTQGYILALLCDNSLRIADLFSFSAEAAEEKFPSWNVDDCRDNKAIQRIYNDIELYRRASKSVSFPTGHPNAPRGEGYQINEMRKQHFGGMISIIQTQGYILALLCDNLLRIVDLENDK